MGLCLPRRILATSEASRPSTAPSVSITYQRRSMSRGFGEKVFMDCPGVTIVGRSWPTGQSTWAFDRTSKVWSPNRSQPPGWTDPNTPLERHGAEAGPPGRPGRDIDPQRRGGSSGCYEKAARPAPNSADGRTDQADSPVSSRTEVQGLRNCLE